MSLPGLLAHDLFDAFLNLRQKAGWTLTFLAMMIGVDSCVFLNLYDKRQPEHQTKRGEIDSF